MAKVVEYIIVSEEAKASDMIGITSIAEEGGLPCDGDHLGHKRIVSSDCLVIPEYARIHGVGIESLDRKNRTVTIHP